MTIYKIIFFLIAVCFFTNCSLGLLSTENPDDNEELLIASLALSSSNGDPVSTTDSDNDEEPSVGTGSGGNTTDNLLITSHSPAASAIIDSPNLIGNDTTRPITDIVLNFNEAADRSSVENAFSVTRGEATFGGSFAWENGDTRVIWTPASYLRSYAIHTVSVLSSARSASGKLLADDTIQKKHPSSAVA